MSTENHLIMRSSCSCATIMCRFCVFEKRMTTMISQQHLRTIPNCSAEMSDRNVVCDTCGEFTRFGLCIGLSSNLNTVTLHISSLKAILFTVISVVCRILVLASDVTRAATLRELFIMTGRSVLTYLHVVNFGNFMISGNWAIDSTMTAICTTHQLRFPWNSKIRSPCKSSSKKKTPSTTAHP